MVGHFIKEFDQVCHCFIYELRSVVCYFYDNLIYFDRRNYCTALVNFYSLSNIVSSHDVLILCEDASEKIQSISTLLPHISMNEWSAEAVTQVWQILVLYPTHNFDRHMMCFFPAVMLLILYCY